MHESITLTLPWPPTVNTYWRHRSLGRKGVQTYVSKEGKAFREGALFICSINPTPPFTGRLEVAVALTAPTRQKYDLDNRMKGLLDALTAAHVWIDDSQVDILHIVRCTPSRKNAGAVVTIRELADE